MCVCFLHSYDIILYEFCAILKACFVLFLYLRNLFSIKSLFKCHHILPKFPLCAVWKRFGKKCSNKENLNFLAPACYCKLTSFPDVLLVVLCRSSISLKPGLIPVSAWSRSALRCSSTSSTSSAARPRQTSTATSHRRRRSGNSCLQTLQPFDWWANRR